LTCSPVRINLRMRLVDSQRPHRPPKLRWEMWIHGHALRVVPLCLLGRTQAKSPVHEKMHVKWGSCFQKAPCETGRVGVCSQAHLLLNDFTRTSRRLERVPIVISRDRQLKAIRDEESRQWMMHHLCVIVSSLPIIDSIPFLSRGTPLSMKHSR
jgi:hypothetical protein